MATTSIPSLIESSAERYGIPFYMIDPVIRCESGYWSDAVGDGGTSFGIAQIHLSAHPDISKEQALDPEFSIDWMAREISDGHGSMWTCFREKILSPRSPQLTVLQ